MGNSVFSSGAFIGVQIATPPSEICSGSPLFGKVCLEVKNDSIAADSINIEFSGKEQTAVQYQVKTTKRTHDGEETVTETKTAHETKIILTVDNILARFNGRINRGRYEYPFEILIPRGLAGKQGTRNNTAEYFVLEYFLEARLHRTGMMQGDVKNSIEVQLRDEPSTLPITPIYVEPDTRRINWLCCINTGTITLGAKLNSSSVSAGEFLRIDFEALNNSSTRVKAIEIRISEHMNFHAQGHSTQRTTHIYTKRIEVSELVSMGLLMAPVDKEHQQSQIDYSSLARALREGKHGLDVSIPTNARSNYNGQLGKVSHNVEVQAKTPFCVDDPELSIPLNICGPRKQTQGMVWDAPVVAVPYDAPADWSSSAHAAPLVKIDMVPTAPYFTSGSNTTGYNDNNSYQNGAAYVYSPTHTTSTVASTTPAYGSNKNDNPFHSAPIAPVTNNNNFPNNSGVIQVSALSPLSQVLNQLKNASEKAQMSILAEWVTVGDVAALSPDGLKQIFKTAKSSQTVLSFPYIVERWIPGGVTCGHVAAAASTQSDPSTRAAICTAFADNCIDKFNAQTAFSSLGFTAFNYQAVLAYYS